MDINDDAKTEGLINLVNSCREILSEEDFNRIGSRFNDWDYKTLLGIVDDIPTSGAVGINNLLIAIYEDISKTALKDVLQLWDSNFIKGHEKEIINGTAKKTIENYHDFIRKSGYLNQEDIKIESYGEGFLVKMVNGCPYTGFCEKTGNVKCIRGTNIRHVMKSHPTINDYVFLLERPEDYACTIKGVPLNQAIDENNKANGKSLISL